MQQSKTKERNCAGWDISGAKYKMGLRQAQQRPEEKVIQQLKGLYERYGYKKYKMSKFEEYSLYAENREFLAGDKIITFTDLDGRLMALKPDVTLSIIKNSNISDTSPEKTYYVENVYRESRESHTFKEINQMGLEYIGALDTYGITEVLALAAETLAAVDGDYILEISHMDYVVELLENIGIKENLKFELLKLIRAKNTDGITRALKDAGLTDRQKEAVCALPGLYGDIYETIKKAEEYVVTDLMQDALTELKEVCKGLETSGAAAKVQVDFSIVNDIDYYNGMIFNGYIKDLAGCVLAGGQYDGALKQMGKNGRAIGFALYLNDISRLSSERTEYDVDAVILYDKNESVSDIADAVRRLQGNGMSVFATTKEPGGIRSRYVYELNRGKLSEKEVK